MKLLEHVVPKRGLRDRRFHRFVDALLAAEHAELAAVLVSIVYRGVEAAPARRATVGGRRVLILRSPSARCARRRWK